MAGTEIAAPARDAGIRPIVSADLPACLELSRGAGWNQNEADWRMMLALGRGWGVEMPGRGQGWGLDGAACPEQGPQQGPEQGPEQGREQSHRLAASAVVIPYSALPAAADLAGNHAAHRPAALPGAAGCAWVSMVLVLPQFRRRGLATRVLRHALEFLHAGGLVPVLDATPAGYPVYLKQGFSPAWGFRRYRREAAQPDSRTASPPRTRCITARDWAAITSFDSLAFGADRSRLLRALADRMPQAARLAQQEGRVTGFSFGRDGREACQLGPMVAQDLNTAQTLLGDALRTISSPVLVDLGESHHALLPALAARGFKPQRPFTRMVHGAAPAPGDPARMVLMAGPELG